MCALCWIEQFTSLLQISPLVAFWFSFSVWSHTNFSYAQRVARFSHVVYMCECAGMRSVSIFFSSFILFYFFFFVFVTAVTARRYRWFCYFVSFFLLFFCSWHKTFHSLDMVCRSRCGSSFLYEKFYSIGVYECVCVCLSLGWWCRMVKWWWWLEEVKKMKMWPVQSRWNVSKYCLLNALWLFCSLLTQNHHI